jgi:hypothetical protein
VLTRLNLPDFLWLWRIAAWSMGLSLTAYGCLAVSGVLIGAGRRRWLDLRPMTGIRLLHSGLGLSLVFLVLLLLAVGLVGTYGHYGNLGHSVHLPVGLTVVILVLTSAWSAKQIHPQRPWARPLHVSLNMVLLIGFAAVTWTGWQVVQKYLPPA